MFRKTLKQSSLLFGLLVIFSGFSQITTAQQVKAGIVAFYNLENLFDTIDTPDVRDFEFTPAGPKKWTGKRYWHKINQMADVISKLGTHENIPGPAVIGLSEMENRAVLEDLIATPQLAPFNYKIVHYDSPDKRGVDVALLYRPRYFHLTNSRSVPLIINNEEGRRIFTRDQLVVSGMFDGEPMHFIVNHWPSRWGGEKGSSPLREAAARLSRALVDSIADIDKNAKVIVMGDLNDDPINKSVYEVLNARENPRKLKQDQLFNATGKLYKEGIGSLAYRGKWNLFDQIIMTQSFLNKRDGGYQYRSTRIYNESYIQVQEGSYKGYPFRSFVGNNYQGGYSDHFPVYVVLVKRE
jgi:hypothetical protein